MLGKKISIMFGSVVKWKMSGICLVWFETFVVEDGDLLWVRGWCQGKADNHILDAVCGDTYILVLGFWKQYKRGIQGWSFLRQM